MADDTLNQLGQYLIWNENKLMEILQKVPDKTFAEPNETLGRSIKDMVNHIWLSYKGYFLGFDSEEYAKLDKESQELSKEQIFVKWKAATSEFAKDVSTKESVYSYPLAEGKKVEISQVANIMQFSDHSSYHRGQLITMIKLVGVEVTSTDFYLFLQQYLENK